MPDKWFISDTHFFHDNIIKYCDRPFASAEEMNEAMIERWNGLVKPNDYVYHLGDVAMGLKGNQQPLITLLQRLNGKKRLIVGNHDPIKSPTLYRFFEKMELWKGFHEEGFTCVHIPLQIEQLRDGKVCVHGHIHNNLVMFKEPYREPFPDSRYINVCVEHTNYAPVSMDEIKDKVKEVG